MPEFSELFWPMFWAFIYLVLAGFGAPFPEEGATIGAGIWVANYPELGPLRWLILPVCFVGILISDISLYGIGRLWGTKLLEHRWTHRLMPPGRRETIQANFERYGVKILLLVRWVPGIRSPLFVTAGTMRLTISRFIIADAIAAAIGHALLFFLAYLGGKQVQDFVEALEKEAQSIVRPLLVLGAVLAVTLYLVWHFWKRPVTTGDPKEFPLIGPQVAAKIEQASSKQEKHDPTQPVKAESEPIKQPSGSNNGIIEPDKNLTGPKIAPSVNGDERKSESVDKSLSRQPAQPESPTAKNLQTSNNGTSTLDKDQPSPQTASSLHAEEKKPDDSEKSSRPPQ